MKIQGQNRDRNTDIHKYKYENIQLKRQVEQAVANFYPFSSQLLNQLEIDYENTRTLQIQI